VKSSHIIHSTYNFIFGHKWQTSIYEAPKPYKTPKLDYPDTLNEAPPRDSGIMSWQWGVTTRSSRNYTLTRGTTTSPSWNYVLALRHHHVCNIPLGYYGFINKNKEKIKYSAHLIIPHFPTARENLNFIKRSNKVYKQPLQYQNHNVIRLPIRVYNCFQKQ